MTSKVLLVVALLGGFLSHSLSGVGNRSRMSSTSGFQLISLWSRGELSVARESDGLR